MPGRTDLIDWFVFNACPDHHVRGRPAHERAWHTAERVVRTHPDIVQDSFYTAIICGDLEHVERLLAERPEAAREKGGPKGWDPLLYLCFTRLSLPAASRNAVAIARALLNHGADARAHFMAGDSRYTPLVGVIGEGEEDRPAHPRRDALARLLLERGAEPYDMQVIYNLHFHGNVLWFLEMMHEHTARLGHRADWDDPEWTMLDMGGYGSGARFLLAGALEHRDAELAEWMLAHGANPNAAPARDTRMSKRSLLEDAIRSGQDDIATLLLRAGATPAEVTLNGADGFAAACLRLDRESARALSVAHPEFLHAPAPMMIAARQDRAEVVALLLELGMSANIEDPTQGTQRALHEAAYYGSLRVAELLLARGAEIDPVESSFDITPLGGAVYAGRTEMVELLSRFSRDVWALTSTGNVERLREVLDEAPERAQAQSDGQTLLMCLPDDEARALEIVRVLLAFGADAAVRNREGHSAADIARQRGLDAAAEQLTVARTAGIGETLSS